MPLEERGKRGRPLSVVVVVVDADARSTAQSLTPPPSKTANQKKQRPLNRSLARSPHRPRPTQTKKTKQVTVWAQENGKTVLLWGWIPAVIALGMLTTKPRPSVLSLIWFG